MISRLLKLIVLLGIVGFIGLTGYSFFGDMSPQMTPQSQTITLNGG
jgi:hypothetical protein